MYGVVIALFGAMLLAWQLATHEPREIDFRNQVAGNVAAANFWAYQSAVAAYAYLHPAAAGTIPDASLAFPAGYVRNAAWTNTVQGGILYTYSIVQVPANTVGSIATRGGNSMTVGVAQSNHTMTSVSGEANGMVLPAMIPSGAVVNIGT